MSRDIALGTMMTPPQVGRRCQVSADKVRGWIASGELRAVDLAARRGGQPRWRIDPVDLEAFLARRAAINVTQTKAAGKRGRAADVIQFY